MVRRKADGMWLQPSGFVLLCLFITLVATLVVVAPPRAGANTDSVWTYQDPSDSAEKTEGGYAPFESPEQTYGQPHGGYVTTSNRCKVCHAVHRATGSFALMRVDSPDDACSYCHVGAHRHAESAAYISDEDGMYAENGHTIGAGPEIPHSSEWQWSEEATVTASGESTDVVEIPSGRLGWLRLAEPSDAESRTITLRHAEPGRNKMMKFVLHGERWVRVGPVRLRCSTCHQVHNAYRQIWRPVSSVDGTVMRDGYKLLRDNPSGLLAVNPADINPDGSLATSGVGPRAVSRRSQTEYDPGEPGLLDGLASPEEDHRLRALEQTVTIATGESPTGATIMGPNVTGFTTYRYSSSETSTVAGEHVPTLETSLSFWCANCHNLTVSGPQQRSAEGLGPDAGVHGWPHPVPGMFAQGTQTEAGSQCYDCHSNDMPLDATLGDACGGCHISPKMYRYYKSGEEIQGKTWADRVTETSPGYPAVSDFPHSGPRTSRDLLRARDRIGAGSAADPEDEQGSAVTSEDDMAKICRSCHAPGAYHAEIYK